MQSNTPITDDLEYWIMDENLPEYGTLVVRSEHMRKMEEELSELKEALDKLDPGVHSCGDHCQRPNCAMRRENKQLREMLVSQTKGILKLLHGPQN